MIGRVHWEEVPNEIMSENYVRFLNNQIKYTCFFDWFVWVVYQIAIVELKIACSFLFIFDIFQAVQTNQSIVFKKTEDMLTPIIY